MAQAQWNGYAGDPQHTAISRVPSQSLSSIRWKTPVDEAPPAGTIYIHYGSPVITAANTVLVPVRTSTGGYRLDAHQGSSVALWGNSTDFVNAPSQGAFGGNYGTGWIPTFSPTLTPTGTLYYQGIGGTVYRIGDPNSSASAPTQLSFLPDYAANKAAYDSTVFISTPLTADAAGNIYFGYETKAGAPGNLPSGIARIASDGSATHISATDASGVNGATGLRLGTNSAPALSGDGSTLYVALKGNGQYLAAVNAIDLTPKTPQSHVALTLGTILDEGTSSPTVGPDGHVYFGTWIGSSNNYRGALNHFSGDLLQSFDPGSFGWDTTPSIIDSDLVASYSGVSDYLVMVKYNDYKGLGDGVNKLAILDPHDTRSDMRLNRQVMKEVLTIAGVTPDSPTPQFPNAVREWCINTAAVDPFTKSILVNCEDGILYRWDLTTNTFTESIELQSEGTLEAYTPTAIGPDGTVYAINKATLFAVGVPEPDSAILLACGVGMLGGIRRRAGRVRASSTGR